MYVRMTMKELRDRYLNFFKKQQHTIISPSSLIPENDPTTLFTGSGMQPMVPYLLGQKHPAGTRIADSQKCFRAIDIEEVGDNRHTTFFEMLGNWSLGDYFKQEQISWMFSFLTEELGLGPNRLYVTCFRGKEDIGIPKDEESATLWQRLFQEKNVSSGIQDFSERDGIKSDARIFYYPAEKNWWSRAGIPENMPIGEPGGPDSEMFWDFGEELRLHEKWINEVPERFRAMREARQLQPCHVNCDCGRFMEIGNNVFMEYVKTQKGFETLPQKNVDFGGGLERLVAALNNNPDIFHIDIFHTSREFLESISGKKYGVEVQETFAFRVILDHLRAATFLIADGAIPSNKDQGYFTRRLIRRAVRYGQQLDLKDSFCSGVAALYVEAYKEAYPELVKKRDYITLEVEEEEKKFQKTLERGLKESKKLETIGKTEYLPDGREPKAYNRVDAKKAFDLYQSYGFPLELIQEELAKRALMVDEDEFNTERKKHQELSRASSEQKFKGGLSDHSEMSVKYHTATHLLHAALQKVLGPQAVQKGSNITPERLRFDFVHPVKMTLEEIQQVEDLVNAAIARDYLVSWQELSLEDARAKHAIGLFEGKYGEKVKVYTVGNPNVSVDADSASETFSREICGGPHVEHTGVLGHFKIIKEEASSAGVRRIKAILEDPSI
ncbi:MAG: hypothetical protein A3G08_00345 [Candidatus Magasanikbacteria bacterium RIFCSPLOWO2_12_FULL_47_9b]|nr:MAG: hypothetical protein A3I74_00470 [Candidatus Magasanikbacteria bacterium RIFCSPLOWO2_02_FULL_47_16]OGH80075.1 MAG: hypothetical protein A3C10_02755 [Candidatus Magasanikbacteria bacterium RIFCSPHIGHO2_02_FULL_48_18]OGH83340.1 MAG: hypothetical protein A3G08_00345 [Candidatus Magasanikbacteria bacterium RIFCSPLOWO2_12_FULL_47_9b]